MAQSDHPRRLSYQGVHLMVDPDAAVAGALGGHQGEPVVLVVLCGMEQRGASTRGCAPPDPAGCGRDAGEGWKKGIPPRYSPRIASCRHSRKHRSCSSPTPPAARRRRVTNAAAVEISVLISAPAPLPAPPGPAPAAGGGSAQQPHGAGGTGRVCCAGHGAGPARMHGRPGSPTARLTDGPARRAALGRPAHGRSPAAPPSPALIHPNGINGCNARPRSRPGSALAALDSRLCPAFTATPGQRRLLSSLHQLHRQPYSRQTAPLPCLVPFSLSFLRTQYKHRLKPPSISDPQLRGHP